jgi:hypothetical protein
LGEILDCVVFTNTLNIYRVARRGINHPGYSTAPDESGLTSRIDPAQSYSPADLSPGEGDGYKTVWCNVFVNTTDLTDLRRFFLNLSA